MLGKMGIFPDDINMNIITIAYYIQNIKLLKKYI